MGAINTCDEDPELRPPGRGASGAPAAVAAAASSPEAAVAAASREFHPQAVPVVVVAVARVDRVIRIPNPHTLDHLRGLKSFIPGIFELYERERRPPSVLQVDERHLAEFVEQILYVLGADVRGQIPHVDSAIVAAV
jgi:hypothetical protein